MILAEVKEKVKENIYGQKKRVPLLLQNLHFQVLNKSHE